MAMDKAEKDGLDPDIINRVLNWMIVGIFVGGHLGHALFYEPYKAFGGMDPSGRYIEGDILYLFKFWDGLSSFGGFIITSFLCWVFFQKENRRIINENKNEKNRTNKANKANKANKTNKTNKTNKKNLFSFQFGTSLWRLCHLRISDGIWIGTSWMLHGT